MKCSRWLTGKAHLTLYLECLCVIALLSFIIDKFTDQELFLHLV